MVAAPFLLMFVSLFIGRYPLSMGEVLSVLGTKAGFPALAPYHTYERGMGYTPSRAIWGPCGRQPSGKGSLPGLFRNPLVSSGVLGVSAGAGFGAYLAIILFGSDTFYVYVFAFCFGILAVVLSYVIGTNYTSTPTIMLVLGGVVVSSIFSSLVSLLKYIADPYEQLPSIVFWLMGSMASARFKDIAISAIPMGGNGRLVAMRGG